MPHYVASDLGLQCLPISNKKDPWLIEIWVNKPFFLEQKRCKVCRWHFLSFANQLLKFVRFYCNFLERFGKEEWCPNMWGNCSIQTMALDQDISQTFRILGVCRFHSLSVCGINHSFKLADPAKIFWCCNYITSCWLSI